MNGCMSEVFRSFFSYQVAVGSTMSEYRQVVDMRKSSVHDQDQACLPARLSCQTHFLTASSSVLQRQDPCPARRAAFPPMQVLEKIFMALAGGAKHIGAPDKHIAGPVVRIRSGSSHANPRACRILEIFNRRKKPWVLAFRVRLAHNCPAGCVCTLRRRSAASPSVRICTLQSIDDCPASRLLSAQRNNQRSQAIS
jgi:hypothetical protein